MNDFDEQEPGTIESIIKFTKETYGTNFEIFDKVNYENKYKFCNFVILDNDGTSSVPIFVGADKTRTRLELLEIHCETIWNCQNCISTFCHPNRIFTDVGTIYPGN